MDLANLFDHAHREFRAFIRKLNAYLVVMVFLAAPDDGARRFEGWLPHRNRNLDITASLESVMRLKAQSTRTDILQAMPAAESEVSDAALNGNVGRVTNEMSHRQCFAGVGAS